MRWTRWAVAVGVTGVLCVAAAGATACHTQVPTSITTPQGIVAYQAEDALDAIGVLQHAAIVARRNNVIQTPAMRILVKATMAAAKTIDTAIDNGTGLQAAYKTASAGLTQARAALPPEVGQKVAVEFDAAQAILAALGGI